MLRAMKGSLSKRPRLFPPGVAIGQHLQVERVVRESADRTLYLVNNARRRWYTVKCWSCGNKHSPPSAACCSYCGKPLGFKRLLMCSRWDAESISTYTQYARRRVKSPSLGLPLSIYRYRDQMLSFYDWDGDQVLSNASAPLSPRQLLMLAFQLSDALQSLHDHGVHLGPITADHVMFRPDGSARLFDFNVERLARKSVEPSGDPTETPNRDIRALAAMLDDFCPVEAEALRDLLTRIRRGAVDRAGEIGGLVADWSRRHPVVQAQPMAGAHSDAGLRRRTNDDRWAWRPLDSRMYGFFVADGEGGAAASDLVVRTGARVLKKGASAGKLDLSAAKKLVQRVFSAAQEAVDGVASEGGGVSPYRTTLAAVLTVRNQAVIGTVGDTRVWVWTGGTLRSLVQPPEVPTWVGHGSESKPVTTQATLGTGDRLLVGSRGLWQDVSEAQMARILTDASDPRTAARRLVRAANDAGGRDNITAMVINSP